MRDIELDLLTFIQKYNDKVTQILSYKIDNDYICTVNVIDESTPQVCIVNYIEFVKWINKKSAVVFLCKTDADRKVNYCPNCNIKNVETKKADISYEVGNDIFYVDIIIHYCPKCGRIERIEDF